jgi:predicted TIM-barrel fold metal-dependent hydrolase
VIIDIHSHLAFAPIYPENFLSDMFTRLKESEKLKLCKMLPLFLRDKEGTLFLKQMDLAGIDKTVLLIIDGGIGLREAKLSIDEIYKVHYNILKNFSDRFVVFAGIDPRRENKGFDLFRKGIEEYNFRGLKLYPPMGFSMESNELLAYFEYCEHYKLPILIHTGPSQENLKNEYANPLFIKPLAEKYKRIIFILAHAGYNLNNDLVKLIKKTNNVYIDVAGFQSKYPKIDDQMIRDLSILFNEEKINSKVLFGTDWPLFNFIRPVSTQVEQVKELASVSQAWKTNALDNIFFKNATKILNLY